jgi:antitoxin component of RelBE/YafQ-DinJ toxin-antitoxin module
MTNLTKKGTRKKPQKTIRNFRLNDQVWLRAQKRADDLGVTMTFLVENLLRNFIQNPHLTIGEPELMKLTPKTQEDVDRLAEIADKAISKKKSLKKK